MVNSNETFKNLQVLKITQESVKEILGEKYNETVITFIDVIQKGMITNNFGALEAVKMIKDKTTLYNMNNNTPLLFSAALIEIIEGTYFDGFAK